MKTKNIVTEFEGKFVVMNGGASSQIFDTREAAEAASYEDEQAELDGGESPITWNY